MAVQKGLGRDIASRNRVEQAVYTNILENPKTGSDYVLAACFRL